MICSTSRPWLVAASSRLVAKRMSTPYTPHSTATCASWRLARVWVRMRALSPRPAIVSQALREAGDATGVVSSMKSTPKASRSFTTSILSSSVKLPSANCSPSRRVESMMCQSRIAMLTSWPCRRGAWLPPDAVVPSFRKFNGSFGRSYRFRAPPPERHPT